MAKLNKNEIEYIKKRIDEVVRCTNGNIASAINEQIKDADYTVEEKYVMIVKGIATPIGLNDLMQSRPAVGTNKADSLSACFNFPITPQMEKDRAHNDKLESLKNELISNTAAAGKTLLDEVILGITYKDEIPKRLEEIKAMSSLVPKEY